MTRRHRGRWRDLLHAVFVAGMASGLLVLVVARVHHPGQGRLESLALGVVYGALVLGLLRLFPVSRWAYPLVGLIVGPVPFALVLKSAHPSEADRGGAWLLTALLGLVIGLLELARAQLAERRAHTDADAPS